MVYDPLIVPVCVLLYLWYIVNVALPFDMDTELTYMPYLVVLDLDVAVPFEDSLSFIVAVAMVDPLFVPMVELAVSHIHCIVEAWRLFVLVLTDVSTTNKS